MLKVAYPEAYSDWRGVEYCMLVFEMSSSFAIRPCELDDLRSILAIYEYYVVRTSTTFEEEVPTLGEMTRRFEAITAKGFPYIVIEKNDELKEEEEEMGPKIAALPRQRRSIVGFAYANNFSGHKYTAEDSIYLHKEYTGRGLGSLLLGDLLRKLQEMGSNEKSLRVTQVVAVLATAEDNPASIKLHSTFGFRNVAYFKEVGFKFGKWIDRVNMQLDLSTLSLSK